MKSIYILFLFILLLVEANLLIKKSCSKKNLVWIFSFSNRKINLTPLIEFIVFHIEFFAIYV